MEPDLLGYLVDGLDDDERDEIERTLRTSREAARQLEILRGVLSPLDDIRGVFDPPTGLAFRTCRRLHAHPAESGDGT